MHSTKMVVEPKNKYLYDFASFINKNLRVKTLFLLKSFKMREYIAGNQEIPEVKKEIQDVAGFLWDKGWAEKNAGNISYNVSELLQDLKYAMDFEPPVELSQACKHLDGGFFVFTGTGTRMRDVAENPMENICILSISDGGKTYRKMQKPNSEREVVPTSELPTHLAIHNMLKATNRPEKAIVHTHPNKLIALTHIREFCNQERINNMLWGIQPETCVFIHDGIGFIPYLQTGSDELANVSIEKLKNHRVALWEKHGCLAIGNTAHEAFDLIDIADKSAEIFFTCKNAGFEAEGISKNDLDKLRKAFGIKTS